jgi:hypothetical protein
MITYKYYKFPSKEIMPPLSAWPLEVNIHEVGPIGNNNAVYNSLGQEIQPQTFLSGWHVNACYQGTPDLSFVQQYEIVVNNPKCIWFGQSV